MAFPPPPDILRARDLRAEDLDKNLNESLFRIYAWMYLARTLDNRILELYRQGLILGTVTGGQGNEGLIVPWALLADKTTDVTSFTHRDLGGHLIWSGHVCEHLNQYFANAQSPTRAREGNIHHGDPKNRSLPMISHLGSMCGPVLGTTDSQRRLGRPAVGFSVFGDGGSSTGDVHEALNLASLLSLPIVFVIENNRYAYSTPVSEQYPAGTELWRRAAGYGIEGLRVDGTDAEATARAFAQVIAQVRATRRPMVVEAHTVRLRGHAAYDTGHYLQPGEEEEFNSHDPLPRLRRRLAALVAPARIDTLEQQLGEFLEGCVRECLPVPRPDPASLAGGVYAPSAPPLAWKPDLGPIAGAKPAEPMNLAQALNQALRKILAERPESILLGQDIAEYGGAFKVTEGLRKDFGRARVLNTPLAESACTGYAIGLAVNGHRPIEEFQFSDFATEATTQITLNAATFHFRCGSACPLVLRLPCGGGLGLGSFHSQDLESLFLSMPGLKAFYPSTSQDAFDCLLAAYEDPNPVLIFEHKGLYRHGRTPLAWNPDYRGVWQPRPVRQGDYATFVTYGEMVQAATTACDYFATEYEAACDLFDLRCLAPLDLRAVEASLRRTGRLIVLHEGRRTHGVGAEVVSQLTERCFPALKAAPLRLASRDMPVPFAPELEAAFRPSQAEIVEAISAWMG